VPVFGGDVSGLCEMGLIVVEGLGLGMDQWTGGWKEGCWMDG